MTTGITGAPITDRRQPGRAVARRAAFSEIGPDAHRALPGQKRSPGGGAAPHSANQAYRKSRMHVSRTVTVSGGRFGGQRRGAPGNFRSIDLVLSPLPAHGSLPKGRPGVSSLPVGLAGAAASARNR